MLTRGVCKSKKQYLLIAYCLRLLVLRVPLFELHKENVALQCPESYGIRPTNDRHTIVEAPDEGNASKNEFWWSESTRNSLCIVV